MLSQVRKKCDHKCSDQCPIKYVKDHKCSDQVSVIASAQKCDHKCSDQCPIKYVIRKCEKSAITSVVIK